MSHSRSGSYSHTHSKSRHRRRATQNQEEFKEIDENLFSDEFKKIYKQYFNSDFDTEKKSMTIDFSTPGMAKMLFNLWNQQLPNMTEIILENWDFNFKELFFIWNRKFFERFPKSCEKLKLTKFPNDDMVLSRFSLIKSKVSQSVVISNSSISLDWILTMIAMNQNWLELGFNNSTIVSSNPDSEIPNMAEYEGKITTLDFTNVQNMELKHLYSLFDQVRCSSTFRENISWIKIGGTKIEKETSKEEIQKIFKDLGYSQLIFEGWRQIKHRHKASGKFESL